MFLLCRTFLALTRSFQFVSLFHSTSIAYTQQIKPHLFGYILSAVCNPLSSSLSFDIICFFLCFTLSVSHSNTTKKPNEKKNCIIFDIQFCDRVYGSHYAPIVSHSKSSSVSTHIQCVRWPTHNFNMEIKCKPATKTDNPSLSFFVPLSSCVDWMNYDILRFKRCVVTIHFTRVPI